MNSDIESRVFQKMPLRSINVRGVIKLSSSILYPEKSMSYFSRRDKPPNCRTVFVGGLPQFTSEQLIKEIFEICGSLEDILVPEQGYCYVTFTDGLSVEKAMYFSGYRLKIEDKDEQPYTGLLFVDYALTEFSNNSSNIAGENASTSISYPENSVDEHRNHMIQDFENVVSGLLYSAGQNQDDSNTHLASFCICEKLNDEETFTQTVDILKAWLEKEEFLDNNAASFFTMMHCFRKHLLKLHTIKTECEEIFKGKEAAIIENFQEINHSLMAAENVYSAGLLEKCSTHLTPAERKNVEQWKKYTEDLKSDIKKKIEVFKNKEETEVDQRNVEVVKQMSDDMKKHKEDLNVLQCGPKEHHNLIKITNSNYEKGNCSTRPTNTGNHNYVQSEAVVSSGIADNEALIISHGSIYLQCNPGSDIESVQTHLRNLGLLIDCETLEKVMKRFSSVFQEKVSGVGSNLQKKWYYVAFNV